MTNTGTGSAGLHGLHTALSGLKGELIAVFSDAAASAFQLQIVAVAQKEGAAPARLETARQRPCS
ncbi:MAG: hypothetical protein ACREGK_07250, partial [Geminicoccales bacterium]